MTDPVADLLARIRNGLTARHESVEAPYSQIKLGIVKILYEEGYVGGYKMGEGPGGGKRIQIRLRYGRDKKPILNELARVSRPGCRIYRGYQDLKPLKNGMGLMILSTPRGIVSDRQAREEKIGGEVLCSAW